MKFQQRLKDLPRCDLVNRRKHGLPFLFIDKPLSFRVIFHNFSFKQRPKGSGVPDYLAPLRVGHQQQLLKRTPSVLLVCQRTFYAELMSNLGARKGTMGCLG
jgi:hypothetical protein